MSNNNRYHLPDAEMVEDALPREVLSACVEMALKDHQAGHCVSHDTLMSRIKEQRGWK